MVNKKLRRFEEKHALALVFVLLAVLVLGSLIVMPNLKMTGQAIIADHNQSQCVEANYTWQNVTGEDCTDRDICLAGCPTCEEVVSEECENLTYILKADCEVANYTWQNVTGEDCTDRDICLAGCPACVDVVIGGQCIGDVCGDGGIQNPNDDGVAEVCDYGAENGIECSPDYGASCQYCSDTCELLITLEGSSCGDGTCDSAEDCDSCSSDCACDSGYNCVSGSCEEIVEETTPSVTGAVVDDMTSSCVSNWECGEWTACTGGTQTRECADTNNCVSPTENPYPILLSCTGSGSSGTSETQETCSDGMMNQDEKGIDCGGVCEERCGFFTIMGNAVNVPINSSKQFVQNNKAISFSLLGVIVLAVSWIVCVKVFLKKKNLFFFLENVNWSKCSKCFDFLKRKKKTNPNNM